VIDIGIAMLIGFMAGLFIKPKDKDLTEQKEIYENKLFEYRKDVEYYKDLCKWHVEQRNKNGNKD